MTNGRCVLACLMVLCGILALLLFKNDDIYTELVFSKQSGFYEDPFELELYGPPGTQIFYTLDGSDPNQNSTRYTSPIMIGNATENENVYSMRTDVSTGFLSQDIAVYSMNDPQYCAPNYNIDKCTVVRSAYRDADGNFSEIKTESYFIGYEEKSGYEDLNIISIVSDPDNLFDYDTGIYVLGRTYDEFVKGDREHFWANAWWWWWEANYNQKGVEWERTANIQLFDTERNLLLNKDCGIRIQGGGSRGKLPRSMNIYARDQYDGEGRFYLDLFNTNYMADTITLFAGGDDATAKLRDMLIARLTADRNFATMNYIPYAMFLDGEYWGVYWLTEKYDDVYLSHYYNVDKDNIIMIKNYEPVEGEENYELYTQMMNYMNNTDLSIDENYQYACELIDIQSYIDYYATEIYIGKHIDWPGSNEALWRVCEKGNGKFEDGRWRWLLFDVNSGALTSNYVSIDSINTTMDMSKMFYNLCQNDDFKRQFTITFMDLINSSFTNANVDSIISEHVDLMEMPTKAQLKRFYGTDDTHKFTDAVSDIQNFLNHRKPYILQFLKDNFGLTGTLASVEIEISDTASGNIILNSIEPSFSDDRKWKGEYYTDYPITLAVTANDGYRFVQWESSALPENECTSEAIELNITEKEISIKAIFEKIEK